MATYNTDGLDKGKSLAREEGGVGVMATSVYRHPQSGEEAIVQYDPLFGNAQANAFERLGFQFVREAKPEEIKTFAELVDPEKGADSDTIKGLTARLNLIEGVQEQNKVLTAELDKQRQERAERPLDATDISGERARQSAADQASVRTQANGEVAVTDSGDMVKVDGMTPKQVAKVVDDNADAPDRVPQDKVGFGAPQDDSAQDDSSQDDTATDESEDEKPLDKQNRDELEATAASEGVEEPSNVERYKTKKELVQAIESRRAESQEADEAPVPAIDEPVDEDEQESEIE